MKNIELKIKVDNLKNVRDRLISISAKNEGILNQIDTYFNSEKGRFKLREINVKEFELIYYERPDIGESKVSMYEFVLFDANEAEKMKKILNLTNRKKVIVEKKRELWIYKNTRIHMDRVEGLGEYLELETVVKDISMEEAEKEHGEVIKLLELDTYEKCEVSYSDLLLEI